MTERWRSWGIKLANSMMIDSEHGNGKGRQIDNGLMAISHNKCLWVSIHHSPLSALHIPMTAYKTHVQTANIAFAHIPHHSAGQTGTWLHYTVPGGGLNRGDHGQGIRQGAHNEINKNFFLYYKLYKQTPWPLVRERTIPTDRSPLVGEI
jgi:hypothetical protein